MNHLVLLVLLVNYKHPLIENIKYKVLHQNKNTSEAELVQIFIQKLNLSAQVIANIEKATRGQSRESLWYKIRSGRLTVSKHHDIYTKTNSVIKASGPVKPKAAPIVAKFIYNDGKISTPPMKWGQDNGENAFKNFYAEEVSKHQAFKAEKCGTILGKIKSYIAASPDGIVTCKCHGKGPIEIKCSYSIRDKKISGSFRECDFLITKNNGSVTLQTINIIPKLFLKWQLQRQCITIL